MTTAVTTFKYEQLDADTAAFLRKKEHNMRQIVGKAYTQLGRELYEAQQRLASHNKYEGVFERWYTYLGFKRQKVYDLINRYTLLRNSEDIEMRKLIEDLPVSLTYEIAKPSAESTPAKAQAKSEVLEGKIRTLKAYKERIKELEKKNRELAERERKAVREAEEAKKEVDRRVKEELERVKKQINDLYTQKEDLIRQMDSSLELSELYVDIEDLLKNKLAPIKYSRAVMEARRNEVVIRNLTEIIAMVDEWSYEMKRYLPSGNYIDGEIIEVEK